MELSILLMEQIAKLFLMIFMGYAVVKLGLLTDEDSKVLSTLVLYLIVPSVILNAFQVDYTQEKVNGLKLAGIASLLLFIILLFQILQRSHQQLLRSSYQKNQPALHLLPVLAVRSHVPYPDGHG